MSPASSGARPEIRVDGSLLSEADVRRLRRVVVESDLLAPDACTVTLDDPGRDILAGGPFRIGVSLELVARPAGGDTGEVVFDGVVYALGAEFDDRGASATIKAYDRSHALYTGLRTKTYTNVADSDVAEEIAREVGLKTGQIDATSVIHDHVSQVNETYFDFLGRRGREADRTLLVTGQELSFVATATAADAPAPGDLGSQDPLQLVFGRNLESLAVRMTAAEQVAEVEVRSWDPATKQALVSTQRSQTRSSTGRDRPDAVAAGLGDGRHVRVDLPLSTQAQCDAVAQADSERIAGAFLHADGTATGNPKIQAGAAVSLGNTGGSLDARVTVTVARHTWDARGYRTEFIASGRHDRSLDGLLAREGGRPGADRIPGVVPAVVTNVSDPDDRSRVRLKFPWLADDYESDWARVLLPGAGADRGLVLLPEVNDEVLVAFEQGDTRRPYVIGGLFNGVDKSPLTDAVDDAAGTVDKRAWRSRSGHELLFVDKSGQEQVVLRTKQDEITITLDAAKQKLDIQVKGDATISAQGDVTVAAQGKAQIRAHDINVDASGSASISATQGLELSSQGTVTVRGQSIRLN